MKVYCLLFAKARDLAGSSRLELELSAPATTKELRDVLGQTCPALLPLLPHLLLARNNAYLPEGTILHAEDELACFPPVSGG
jgi:molybdopterin converting factor small subunit